MPDIALDLGQISREELGAYLRMALAATLKLEDSLHEARKDRSPHREIQQIKDALAVARQLTERLYQWDLEISKELLT